MLLAALLRRYVEGDREGFEVRARAALRPPCVRVCVYVQHVQPAPPGLLVADCLALPAPVCLDESMQASMAVEAAELATASFGDVMLTTIGGVYKAGAAAAVTAWASHHTCGPQLVGTCDPCRRLTAVALAACAPRDCRLSRTLRWVASSMATWPR